tara:strand:+ start:136 stop:921 length:786 start_codon:yes stop_codon:yes gene_type:complete
MSIRTLTDEQFSDGTTVDGDRLAKALTDTEKRFDQIPDGDLLERHMQTQMVLGWAGPIGADITKNIQYPWLPTNNVWTMPGSTIMDRFKGLRRGDDAGTGVNLVMTVPVQLGSPAVIQAIDTLFLTRIDYHNWNPADFINDRNSCPHIMVYVDNPFLPEDVAKNSVVLHQIPITANAIDVTGESANTGVAATADMYPPYNDNGVAGKLRGVHIKADNLNIPLPANARVRFCMSFFAILATKDWKEFEPSITVTLLEGLISG